MRVRCSAASDAGGGAALAGAESVGKEEKIIRVSKYRLLQQDYYSKNVTLLNGSDQCHHCCASTKRVPGVQVYPARGTGVHVFVPWVPGYPVKTRSQRTRTVRENDSEQFQIIIYASNSWQIVRQFRMPNSKSKNDRAKNPR
eukprot:1608188-Rhodomonas_salina.1